MTVDLSKGLLSPGVHVLGERIIVPPGGKVVGVPTEAGHKLNADQTVAVATDVFWNEDMGQAPRGCKIQLLGAGGVAAYGSYHGDPFWVGWCPLPKRHPQPVGYFKQTPPM